MRNYKSMNLVFFICNHCSFFSSEEEFQRKRCNHCGSSDIKKIKRFKEDLQTLEEKNNIIIKLLIESIFNKNNFKCNENNCGVCPLYHITKFRKNISLKDMCEKAKDVNYQGVIL